MEILVLTLLVLLAVVFIGYFVLGYVVGIFYQIDLPFIDVMDERGRLIFRKDADGWTGITRRGKTFEYDEAEEPTEKDYEESFTAEGE